MIYLKYGGYTILKAGTGYVAHRKDRADIYAVSLEMLENFIDRVQVYVPYVRQSKNGQGTVSDV